MLTFLLNAGTPEALGLAERTLTAIAHSPLRDPIDGGFFRYATRRDWSEPHYERMLYDNAQLLDAYATLAVCSPNNPDAAGAAEGIVDFLTTVLRLPSGGFASAQNSESLVDGVLTEGDYYALDASERAQQPRPARDEKVLTGWNGLAVGALASAGFLLDRDGWVQLAAQVATELQASQIQESGRLIRASMGGIPSSAGATLEDYGLLAQGFLNLAQATGEVEWAVAARNLVDACVAEAAATSGAGGTPEAAATAEFSGAAFAVPGGGDPVLAAQGMLGASDPSEGASPSGQSALAAAAYRLYLLTGNDSYRVAAVHAMETVSRGAVAQPMGFGSALTVMTELSSPVTQLVVVSDHAAQEFSDYLRTRVRPGSITAMVTGEQAEQWAAAGFELFAGRATRQAATGPGVTGQRTTGPRTTGPGATGPRTTTAYLCRDFVCTLPVTDLAALVLLDAPVADDHG